MPDRSPFAVALLAWGLVGCPAADSDAYSGSTVDSGSPLDASDAPVCDVEAPTACADDDLGYDDVVPIIEERCLSCHDGSMDLWPLTTYAHVTAWYVEIRAMMLTCGMPPPDSGITMPVQERELLLHWIRCGFPL